MTEIEQDITKIEKGIIFQQVNCQGVMGAGLAKQIRNTWLEVYIQYTQYVQRITENYKYTVGVFDTSFLLGHINICEIVPSKLYVCNLFGQDRTASNTYTKVTCYAALMRALDKAARQVDPALQQYFPYQMSCGLANGDWTVVEAIIGDYFPDAIICKPPEKLRTTKY